VSAESGQERGPFAATLKRARTDRGLSIRDLARELSAIDFPIKHQRLSDYENGKLPRDDTFCSAAEKVLELSAGELQSIWVATRSRRFAQTDRGNEPVASNNAIGADESDGPERRTHRRKWWLVGAGAVIAVLGLVLFVVTRPQASSVGSPAQACDRKVGAFTYPAPPSAEARGTVIRDAFARAGGQTVLGCPASVAHTWGQVVIQELTQAGQPAGVLLSGRPDQAIALTRAEWGGYSQIGSATGDNASVLAGFPMDIRVSPSVVTLSLSGGGVLVGERPDSAFFWVPAEWLTAWNRNGGVGGALGMVSSNTYSSGSGLRQDYVGGYLLAQSSDRIGVSHIATPRTYLPRELPGNAILRQTDGTAWWIDSSHRRWWIPDGGTWECLGGWNRVAKNDVPGFAIRTLALGGQATCSQKP
jgi:transcriptional regulator with XRE-family HTH domain